MHYTRQMAAIVVCTCQCHGQFANRAPHTRFIVIAAEHIIIVSLHLCWWALDDASETLDCLYCEIVEIRNKYAALDSPLIILADAGVSLKRQWSLDDNTDTSVKHFISGPLALEGNR